MVELKDPSEAKSVEAEDDIGASDSEFDPVNYDIGDEWDASVIDFDKDTSKEAHKACSKYKANSKGFVFIADGSKIFFKA